MARDYAKLLTRIWADSDFKQLTGTAQRLYFQLISQPDMSMAGVVTLAENAGHSKCQTRPNPTLRQRSPRSKNTDSSLLTDPRRRCSSGRSSGRTEAGSPQQR